MIAFYIRQRRKDGHVGDDSTGDPSVLPASLGSDRRESGAPSAVGWRPPICEASQCEYLRQPVSRRDGPVILAVPGSWPVSPLIRVSRAATPFGTLGVRRTFA